MPYVVGSRQSEFPVSICLFPSSASSSVSPIACRFPLHHIHESPIWLSSLSLAYLRLHLQHHSFLSIYSASLISQCPHHLIFTSHLRLHLQHHSLFPIDSASPLQMSTSSHLDQLCQIVSVSLLYLPISDLHKCLLDSNHCLHIELSKWLITDAIWTLSMA